MTGEIVVNFLFLGIGAFLFVLSSQYQSISAFDTLGPAFWPRVVIILLMICSAVLLVQNIKKKKAETKETAVSVIDPEELKRFFKPVALCIVYFLSMSYLGFILSTFIFQICFMLIQGVRKVRTLLGVPTLLTLAMCTLFIKILYLPLPKGVSIFRAFSLLFY